MFLENKVECHHSFLKYHCYIYLGGETTFGMHSSSNQTQSIDQAVQRTLGEGEEGGTKLAYYSALG